MDKKILLIGGAGLAAMYFLGNKKTVVSNVVDGEPKVLHITQENFLPIDRTFPGWYNIMAKLYPKTVDPNYVLSDDEANQLLANYSDIRQALTKGKNSNLTAAARIYWSQFGIPQKRTFLPLKEPVNIAYNGPGVNYFSETSIGSALVDMLGYISTGISMFGAVDDNLKEHEIDVIFNGAAIIKPMLQFFQKDERSDLINRKLTSILEHYSITDHGI